MQVLQVASWEEWRSRAREALQQELSPADVVFREIDEQRSLFGGSPSRDFRTVNTNDNNAQPSRKHTVPPAFLEVAGLVACHRDSSRWDRLYRVLWRLTHGEPHLLKVAIDDDVRPLLQMQKAVTRDRHKMKAFVRFREVQTENGEEYIAWHRPDHRIVQLTAPFFARRFPSMTWGILTPEESAYWDQKELRYGPGVPASAAPQADELATLEDLLWLDL